MRILILGDSHARDLDAAIVHLRPTYHTYTITAGRRMVPIVYRYRQNLPAITQFHPSVAIVHMGHNDIVQHPNLNPIPTHPQVVAARILTLSNEIELNHPGIIIFNSSIYPRSCTHDSILDSHQVVSYNKKAKRYGQMLRSLCQNAGYHCLLNNILWRRISRAEEESTHYHADGLHITMEAKLLVATELLPQLEHPQ